MNKKIVAAIYNLADERLILELISEATKEIIKSHKLEEFIYEIGKECSKTPFPVATFTRFLQYLEEVELNFIDNDNEVSVTDIDYGCDDNFKFTTIISSEKYGVHEITQYSFPAKNRGIVYVD